MSNVWFVFTSARAAAAVLGGRRMKTYARMTKVTRVATHRLIAHLNVGSVLLKRNTIRKIDG